MTPLSDAAERERALTDLSATLLLEAAAGTGKTAIIAGRVTMLLASGVAPGAIAAITFTEFAASELGARVVDYVDALRTGAVPEPLRIALPDGLSESQRRALDAAAKTLDEITATTIHAFFQILITAHAIDAGIDPGAQVMDAQAAQAALDSVFDNWLERRLATEAGADDPIAHLAKDNPRKAPQMLCSIARLRLDHRRAQAPRPDAALRPDLDFAQAVAALRAWYDAGPAEPKSAAAIGDLETLVAFFGQSFAAAPTFTELWRLAHPPSGIALMEWKTKNLKLPFTKRAWADVVGREAGRVRHEEFETRFTETADQYRRLVGHVAGSVMWRLSQELDELIAAYDAYKRNAALLDFDDLQTLACALVRGNGPARDAIAERFTHILIDEFQDTDPVQAEILFRIAAVDHVTDWTQADLRPGALFMVGDPKQAIYAFRGADVSTYDRARAALEHRWPENTLKIGANFRSRPAILTHVNACFAAPLSAERQPGYVALVATLHDPDHGAPAAAKLTIAAPENAKAAQLRQLEASAVADVCARLIGSFPVGDRTLRAGDIALLAPGGRELWYYEQALSARNLPFISQAGKGLFRRQETQDVLALARTLADRSDTLAFGGLMRGPLVGLTEEEMLDIVVALPERGNWRRFTIATDAEHIDHTVARQTLLALQELSRRARTTTPFLILSEALERLKARAVLDQRGDIRGARAWANVEAVLERARPYGVGGLRKCGRDLTRDWQAGENTSEGRLDAEGDTIQIITMHSAKGLEWPVVIPINATTWQWSPRDYVHRAADDTLHWIIDDVRSPELAASLDLADQEKQRENARVWYVTCTRARELLIIPKIAEAAARSWARVVDLAHDALPEWDIERYEALSPEPEREAANAQAAAVFAAEKARIDDAAQPTRWLNPSAGDFDRAPIAEAVAGELPDAPEAPPILGAGRRRGLILHKLMEEVLTGETKEDSTTLEARATALTDQLADRTDFAERPDAREMAAAVRRALDLEDVAAVRATLTSEWPLYAEMGAHEVLAGRADAIAIEAGGARIVFDWKSDVAPTEADVALHAGQLRAYLAAAGARRGALVYMSTGAVRWLGQEP